MSDKTPSLGYLPVMEAFYTVQGEGVYQGQAAYFIRLGGCDVGCVWCDVKDSWEAHKHPRLSVDQIVQSAMEYPSRLAIITGGEPVMYNLHPLCNALKAKGFRVHLETSGVHTLRGDLDWICLSPKKFKKTKEEYYSIANELKIIIYNKSDFAWAEQHASKTNSTCKLLLQPEWSKQQEMLPLLIEYVKQHPKWQISLQTHKFMDIP